MARHRLKTDRFLYWLPAQEAVWSAAAIRRLDEEEATMRDLFGAEWAAHYRRERAAQLEKESGAPGRLGCLLLWKCYSNLIEEQTEVGSFFASAGAEAMVKKKQAVTASPAAPTSEADDTSTHPDEQGRFRRLADRWKRESLFMSSPNDMAALQSYASIIGMGKKVIPLLLAELQKEPDHWFTALSILSGANPVPDEDAGDMDAMAKAWIAWGRSQGYL